MGAIRTELKRARDINKILEHEIAVLKDILRRANLPFNEVKRIASKIPKKVTEEIGGLIKDDYLEIDNAIKGLDKSDEFYPEDKHNLQQLKKLVPLSYSVSTQDRHDIIDEINDVLGVNRSDR